MFVYLCAIWKTKCDAFLERLPKDSEEILPAGIVYSTANPKAVSLSVPNDENGFQKTLRQKHLKRNGFFLAEEDVLRAMDDRLPHMAYKADKTGSYKTDNKKLFGSLVEFGEMLDDAEHAVLSSARRMRAGCADIAPDKDADKCGDCPYRVICRIEGVKEKNY